MNEDINLFLLMYLLIYQNVNYNKIFFLKYLCCGYRALSQQYLIEMKFGEIHYKIIEFIDVLNSQIKSSCDELHFFKILKIICIM